MLLSFYVNDSLGNRLRHEGVDYLDSAGNAHVAAHPFYLWLRGGKPEKRQERITRAFQATGLQLIALLLADPTAVGRPYRQLAEQAGLSLGSISHILGDLRYTGHLTLAAPGQKLLVNRRGLFEKWEFGYAARLRPRLGPQAFRLADRIGLEALPERIARAGLDDVLIGGELGASLLTAHLRPQRVTLHVPPRKKKLSLLTTLRLVPDPLGNIDIVDQFGSSAIWRWEHPTANLAHPLLIHAELNRIAADDRLRETARVVFDRYLASVLDGEPSYQRR